MKIDIYCYLEIEKEPLSSQEINMSMNEVMDTIRTQFFEDDVACFNSSVC
jgi:hypothetical protein